MCSVKYVDATISTSVEALKDREAVREWLTKWEYFIDYCERHAGDWVEMYTVSAAEDALKDLPTHLWVEREQEK